MATGGLDALDRLELVSADGTLTISDRRYSSNRARGTGAGAVTIRINAARLNAATVVGAGSLTIDKLAGATVALNLRGPGSLAVKDIAADKLTLAIVGTGRVILAGRAKTAETRFAGAGMVDASALAVTDLIATAEGAGDQSYRASRTATVTARRRWQGHCCGQARLHRAQSGRGQCELWSALILRDLIGVSAVFHDQARPPARQKGHTFCRWPNRSVQPVAVDG